jgi:hypothetical protein
MEEIIFSLSKQECTGNEDCPQDTCITELGWSSVPCYKPREGHDPFNPCGQDSEGNPLQPPDCLPALEEVSCQEACGADECGCCPDEFSDPTVWNPPGDPSGGFGVICTGGTLGPVMDYQCCEGKCEPCPCAYRLCPACCGLENGYCGLKGEPCVAYACDESTGDCFATPNVGFGVSTTIEECEAGCNSTPPPTGTCTTKTFGVGTQCVVTGDGCGEGKSCNREDPGDRSSPCSCQTSYLSSRLVQNFTWKGNSPP